MLLITYIFIHNAYTNIEIEQRFITIDFHEILKTNHFSKIQQRHKQFILKINQINSKKETNAGEKIIEKSLANNGIGFPFNEE